MKILVWDAETSPNIADVWGLFNQNVGLNQLHEVTRIMCFAWMWHGQKSGPKFISEFHDGHEAVVQKLWDLYDEADVVVTWNGKSFDTKHAFREFVIAGMPPPSPVKEVDLLLVSRKHFKFSSHKLDHVSQQMGLEGKYSTGGHGLWRACLNGDPKAWKLMGRYNRQDVALTDQLYTKLLPWIHNHPSTGLYSEQESGCQRCGSQHLYKRGFYYTTILKYQRYQCVDCGGWSRGKEAIGRIEERSI